MVTSARRVKVSDEFAVQTYASLGPSRAVSDFRQGQIDVWSASQATHLMQIGLAGITVIALDKVRLVYLNGAGCYGRNGHEDATAHAALIATLIGKPVRVLQKASRVIDLEGGSDKDERRQPGGLVG